MRTIVALTRTVSSLLYRQLVSVLTRLKGAYEKGTETTASRFPRFAKSIEIAIKVRFLKIIDRTINVERLDPFRKIDFADVIDIRFSNDRSRHDS